MYTLTIVVPEVFEGTLDHWQDCFFSFPADMILGQRLQQVLEFCSRMEWDVTITYGREVSLKKKERPAPRVITTNQESYEVCPKCGSYYGLCEHTKSA